MQEMMDKMSSLLQAEPECGNRGESGGAERGAAPGGGIIEISRQAASCLSQLHATVGVGRYDAAGGGSRQGR
ncbi:unnamed protein product [Ectocarpus sp. CCAP 1310/34]|nr:unnamed protein product [Ectocarpus sp. CCAP 1310/34]